MTMINNIIKTFIDEISEERLLNEVKAICKFHRIQGSPMYREASKYCLNYLKSKNVNAEILSYATNTSEYISTYKTFKEWSCNEAYLDIVFPVTKRIVDYKTNPIKIIQKSCPCDLKNIDIIDMKYGSNPDKYNVDFTNKIVFIHDDFHNFLWTLEKGAIGFISDYIREVENVRTREEMKDSINYTSFWWKGNEKKAFGFVLSPKEGEELQALCSETELKHQQNQNSPQYVQVSCKIDSDLYDGNIEVVEASITGESKESILLMAHLCHPFQSANDNASGCSGAMEIMNTLQYLIDNKKISKPKYTIKMILMPEFTGTFFYLNDGRDLTNIKYGINLDMIGAKQEETTGAINITNLPYSTPSIIDSLARINAKKIHELSNNQHLNYVLYDDISYGIGSDHFILCDPMVNIPCIMIGQWPDKHYHTSTDTTERIDPKVLKFSTVLAISTIYGLCNIKIYQQLISHELLAHFISLASKYEANRQDITPLYNYYKETYCLINNDYSLLTAIYHSFNNHKLNFNTYKQIPARNFTMPIVDVYDLIFNDANKVQLWNSYTDNHLKMQVQYVSL